MKRDECTCELHEGEIVEAFRLPTDEQAAKAVVPAVGALDDPTSRFAAETAEHLLLSAAADVWHDTAIADSSFAVGVVVALVEAEILGALYATANAKWHRVQGRCQAPLVVNVRAGDLNGDRNASSIGQNVALDPELGAVGRVRPREVPPFGDLAIAESSEAHRQSMPLSSS